ncbi:hypothetical protein L195_g040798, partial [Trifolium pratense]
RILKIKIAANKACLAFIITFDQPQENHPPQELVYVTAAMDKFPAVCGAIGTCLYQHWASRRLLRSLFVSCSSLVCRLVVELDVTVDQRQDSSKMAESGGFLEE